MISFPVHNCRKRQQWQVTQRNLQRPGSESELDGRSANRFQTRSVRGGVAQLPDPGETNFLAEMAADHPQAGGAAVHLVDLLDVFETADAAFSLSEISMFVRKRFRFIVAF